MRLKYLNKLAIAIFFPLLLISFPAFGYNPCNEIPPFYECSDVSEVWNGRTHTRTSNCICPPYNKKERNGCLKQFDLPGPFEIIYNRYCAEASPSTEYFNPKIHVRVQTCNIVCWSLSDNLRGDGECKVYPGSFGLPLLRLCARIALPDDPKLPAPADDGYTYAWHLNYEGAPELDPIYLGADDRPVYMARPKICAYWDPSVWDAMANWLSYVMLGPMAAIAGLITATNNIGMSDSVINGFVASTGITPSGTGNARGGIGTNIQALLQPDLWDMNPVKQNTHFHQGGQFILVKMIVAFVKMGVSMGNMIKTMMDKIPPAVMYLMYQLAEIYWLIYIIIIIGEKIIIPVLEYLGQLNNVVAASLGCVMIPLGPNPPPYCPTLSAPLPQATIMQICPTILVGNSYSTVASTSTTPCVNSTVPNNVIANSVRVGFDSLIPLCTSEQTPGDTCVRIKPAGLTASAIHTSKPYDILKICQNVPPTTSELPCVESPAFLRRCQTDIAWCNQGVRIVYAIKGGERSVINNYYDSDYNSRDCTIVKQPLCQHVWGINIGNFADLAVNFNGVEAAYTEVAKESASTTIADRAITDTAVTTISVKAKIFRKVVEHSAVLAENPVNQTTNSLQQVTQTLDPTKICVFDSLNLLLGCVDRPVPPKPFVYECTTPSVVTATCNSTHLRPAMIAQLKIGTAYSTEGPIYAATSTSAGSKINLAGFTYDAYVTDGDLKSKPFSGSHSVAQDSIYGDYKDDAVPYTQNTDGTLTYNNDAIYLKGLEYFQDKYVIGGKSICLSGFKIDDCLTSQTQTNCVLTSLINADYVKCTKFLSDVIVRYRGITLCTAANLATGSGYTEIAVLPEPAVTTGGGTHDIRILNRHTSTTVNGVTTTADYYCYTYTSTSPTKELCTVGNTVDSRHTPSKDFGPILANDRYYAYNKAVPINDDVLAVRNKNAIELDLCTNIPSLPDCSAIDAVAGNSAANGYASWSVAKAGEVSTGTCLTNYIIKDTTKPLSRYCIPNKTSGAVALENLVTGGGCKSGCGIYTDLTYTYNNTSKLLTLSSPSITAMKGGIFKYSFNFFVSDKNNINKLTLKSLGVDDMILIKLNGNKVFSGTDDKGEATEFTLRPDIMRGTYYSLQITNNATTLINPEVGGVVSYTPNIDMKQYLVNGLNSIEFDLVIAGGGYINNIQIEYDNSECASFVKQELSCPAINETEGNTANNGYTSWPSTAAGAVATGSCVSGYERKDTAVGLIRTCHIDRTTKNTAIWEDLIPQSGCKRECSITVPGIYSLSGNPPIATIVQPHNEDGTVVGVGTGANTSNSEAGMYHSSIPGAVTLKYSIPFTYVRSSYKTAPPVLRATVGFGPAYSSGSVAITYNNVINGNWSGPFDVNNGWSVLYGKGIYCQHCNDDGEAGNSATRTIILPEPQEGQNEIIFDFVTAGPEFIAFKLIYVCPP